MCSSKRGRALSPPENININLITPVFNELMDPRALDHLSTSTWITVQTPGGPPKGGRGGILGKRGLIKRFKARERVIKCEGKMERVLAKTRKKGGGGGMGGKREREVEEKERGLFLRWRNCVNLRRGNERLDDREEKFGKTN